MFNTLTRMGASAAGDDYEIGKSLRFVSADDNYLARTPSSAGNRRTWTLSFWTKISTNLGSTRQIFSRGNTSGGDWWFLYFTNTGYLQPYIYEGSGSTNWASSTKTRFRDPAAWYHIVVRMDTTQASSSNRLRIYVNGELDPWGSEVQPNQDTEAEVNTTSEHFFGRAGQSGQRGDFYLAEVHFLDGQSLDASHFGKEKVTTGQWIPKEYTGGNYGTNGFYLDFSDSSNTTSSTLGKDRSGNNNDWTPHNFGIAAGPNNDSLIDTPTNTYATFNPLGTDDSCTYKAGNMTVVCNNASTSGTTIAVSSGKWYVEIIPTAKSAVNPMVGVCYADGFDGERQINESQMGGKGYGYIANGNKALPDGSNPAYGSSYAIDDVIGIALDLDSAQNTVTFYKNNTSQGSIDIDSGTYVFGCSNGQGSSTIEYDIITGQRPFTYTPPTGFQALCTDNLSDPTIKKGTDYFNPVLYTGNGGTQSITGLDFQPDWVWLKSRSAGYHHRLFDAVRGTGKSLRADSSGAEEDGDSILTAFNSNGFSLTQGAYYGNESGTTYASWNWKAGGAASSNSDGSITSSVSANTSAGFSIVSYTGTGSNATVGHGLGVKPDVIVVKSRTQGTTGYTGNWDVYHSANGATKFLYLNTTAALGDQANIWQDTEPTSSVFSIGTAAAVNTSSDSFIAYCFSGVAGYSKFGSFEGNGSTDGTFVFTGFKPAFFMVKNIDEANSWRMWDNKRPGYNTNKNYLSPDSSGGEGSVNLDVDILSNGIKLRNTNDSANKSGNTYIYLAFAETPFKYANAR